MKHYRDLLVDICAKRSRCAETISNLEKQILDINQQLQHIHEYLSSINNEHNEISYKISHPLYAFFSDVFPDPLIKICISYTTMDYCASHEELYPSGLGCMNCLPEYDYYKHKCEKQDVNVDLGDNPDDCPSIVDWNNVIFSTENAREVWKYLEENTGETYFESSLRHGMYKEISMEICVELEEEGDFCNVTIDAVYI